MWKIVRCLVLVTVFVLSHTASAKALFSCTGWECDPPYPTYLDGQLVPQDCYGTPYGCDEPGYCDANPLACENNGPITCGSNQYVCNLGCCTVGGGGTGGTGGGGTGGGECWDGAVNCPAGTVKTSTVSQTFCRDTG